MFFDKSLICEDGGRHGEANNSVTKYERGKARAYLGRCTAAMEDFLVLLYSGSFNAEFYLKDFLDCDIWKILIEGLDNITQNSINLPNNMDAYAEAYIRLGEILTISSYTDVGLHCFNRAIDIDPNNARALCERGKVRVKLGQYSGAAQDFERTISLETDRGRASTFIDDAKDWMLY